MQNKNTASFCMRTHRGKIRRNNQDYLAIDQEHKFAIIADGVGGEHFGDVASRLAVDACLQYLRGLDQQQLVKKGANELANAIRFANETIITIQRNEPKYKKMGTTLSCFWVNAGKVHYSWVGDSRVYLIRPTKKTIYQLSTDHTLDQSKIDPKLSPNLYKRASSILTQRVGSILLLKPDIGAADIEDGDILLSCTDGLSDLVPDELILEYAEKIINEQADSLEKYADKLLDRALDCGGHDNISFILTRIS